MLDELKIIKFSCGQLIVKLVHRVPRTITHSNHDDGQGKLRSEHDRISSLLHIGNGTITHNQQDMISSLFLDDLAGLVDEAREGGGSRQGHMRDEFRVPPEHMVKAVACLITRQEGEEALVTSTGITESIGGDLAVIIKRSECSSNEPHHLHVGVLDITIGRVMQALPAEGTLARPFIRLGEINSEDEVATLKTSLSQRAFSLRKRSILRWN